MEQEKTTRRKKQRKLNKPSALSKAVDLLARQDHSERKMRQKLKSREYTEQEIDGAIERLQQLHYIDDARVCENQFNYLYENSSQSVRKICAKLQQRGFDSDLIRSCIPADTAEREGRAAAKLLRQKFRPDADKEKMMQYLYRQGFDLSLVRHAVEDFRSALAEDSEIFF